MYTFDGTYYRPGGGTAAYVFGPLSETAPYTGNVTANYGNGNGPVSLTWGIDNGIYSGPSNLALSPWLQIVDLEERRQSAVRTWLSDSQFSFCTPSDPNDFFRPTGSPSQSTTPSAVPGVDNCDYSNAAIYGGWGWDPVASASCAPVEATPVDNCDYSNAAIFDGWGWDPVGSQSCEPLSSLETDQNCDYINAAINDGWGWNTLTRMSCAPQ